MRLNICCSIKMVMSELGVNVKAWMQPQITRVQWQGHSAMIWGIPSSGLDLLDRGSDGLWPLASWTESHGAGLKTFSAIDAVVILPYTEPECYTCAHTKDKKNNYYHSHSKRRARWYNIKLVRAQPWHVHSGCTQGPRWAACLWGRGQVEEMVCSVYNLAHRTAGCCSGWPEWQDAASAGTRSLKFPKY